MTGHVVSERLPRDQWGRNHRVGEGQTISVILGSRGNDLVHTHRIRVTRWDDAVVLFELTDADGHKVLRYRWMKILDSNVREGIKNVADAYAAPWSVCEKAVRSRAVFHSVRRLLNLDDFKDFLTVEPYSHNLRSFVRVHSPDKDRSKDMVFETQVIIKG